MRALPIAFLTVHAPGLVPGQERRRVRFTKTTAKKTTATTV